MPNYLRKIIPTDTDELMMTIPSRDVIMIPMWSINPAKFKLLTKQNPKPSSYTIARTQQYDTALTLMQPPLSHNLSFIRSGIDSREAHSNHLSETFNTNEASNTNYVSHKRNHTYWYIKIII